MEAHTRRRTRQSVESGSKQYWNNQKRAKGDWTGQMSEWHTQFYVSKVLTHTRRRRMRAKKEEEK